MCGKFTGQLMKFKKIRFVLRGGTTGNCITFTHQKEKHGRFSSVFYLTRKITVQMKWLLA